MTATIPLPYNLTPDQLVLDPSSWHLRVRTPHGSRETEFADLFNTLAEFNEDELRRVFHSLLALARSEQATNWLVVQTEMGMYRQEPADFMLMALDTAVVWERG